MDSERFCLLGEHVSKWLRLWMSERKNLCQNTWVQILASALPCFLYETLSRSMSIWMPQFSHRVVVLTYQSLESIQNGPSI